MPQTNPLPSAKVFRDTMAWVNNFNTVKGMGNGTLREKISGKNRNI